MLNYTHFFRNGAVYYRKIQSFMKPAFKEMGLSIVDSIILVSVSEKPGIIQEGIAYNLALDDSSVARSLKQMQAKGLIHREIDDSNQRTKKVFITPKGEEYKKKIDKMFDFWNELVFEGVSEKERKAIAVSLEKLQAGSLSINVNKALKEMKKSIV